MLEQKDPYVGERNPQNKKRHGKGVYTYDNNFFQYDGLWNNGIKHGHGFLRMKSGTLFEGQFVNGEIMGYGKINYDNGSIYEGQFNQGEKHGQGVYQTPEGEKYEGEWQFNLRHGKGDNITKEHQYNNAYQYLLISKIGLLQTNEGDIIEGNFFNHKPHGECNIKFANGSSYIGSMQCGLRDGFGKLIDIEQKFTYEGEWKENKKQGKGIFSFNSGFIYNGLWNQDEPTIVSNIFTVTLYQDPNEQINQQDQQQTEEEKKIAEKGQQKPQPNQSTQQEQSNVLEYEIGGKPISLEVRTKYQGPDIVDPNQPTEQEIEEQIKNWQKEAKKQKNPPPMPDFRIKRMIKAPPISVENESGRRVSIYLLQELEPEKGKENEPRQTKKLTFDYRSFIQQRREEIERIKKERALEAEQEALAEQQAGAKKKKEPKKKETKKPEQGEDELKLNLFNKVEEQKLKPKVFKNKNGVIIIEKLEYPEDFPPGKYYLIVNDVSSRLEVYGHVNTAKIEININPPGGVDLKKKKK